MSPTIKELPTTRTDTRGHLNKNDFPSSSSREEENINATTPRSFNSHSSLPFPFPTRRVTADNNNNTGAMRDSSGSSSATNRLTKRHNKKKGVIARASRREGQPREFESNSSTPVVFSDYDKGGIIQKFDGIDCRNNGLSDSKNHICGISLAKSETNSGKYDNIHLVNGNNDYLNNDNQNAVNNSLIELYSDPVDVVNDDDSVYSDDSEIVNETYKNAWNTPAVLTLNGEGKNGGGTPRRRTDRFTTTKNVRKFNRANNSNYFLDDFTHDSRNHHGDAKTSEGKSQTEVFECSSAAALPVNTTRNILTTFNPVQICENRARNNAKTITTAPQEYTTSQTENPVPEIPYNYILDPEETEPSYYPKSSTFTFAPAPKISAPNVYHRALLSKLSTSSIENERMTPISNTLPSIVPTKSMNGSVVDDVSAGDSNATDSMKEQKADSERSKTSPKRHKRTSDPNHVSHQFFHLEPCLYSHRMFERAARIFSVLKHDDADTEEKKALRRRNGEVASPKEKIPDMEFIDSQEQIKTFELTFATLKFQKLFSSILDYIGFFYKYSELNEHYSLVYVILHDLQTRRFQRRVPFPDEALDPVCWDVEEALLAEKTKLQANIAKERIKNNAPSVDYLLPEHVRNKDETKSKTPVYMWVNQMKTTIDNVISNLKADNFLLMDSGTDMSDVTDHAFLVDPHCSDMLTFPPHLNMELKSSDMVKSGLLVQQDKSSCLAPQTVTHLIGNDNDIIHVNIGTAMTTCHIASLLRHKSPHSHIWAFGVDGPSKVTKVMKTMEFLEVKNVKIVQEEFLNIDPEDSKFKGVRVILISANCSKSAITSPVQFIVSEGEDTQILGELSVGEADMNHVRDLMVDHERLLKHALKFPKLQAVVYSTRSRFELENELVINKVLEYVNATSSRRNVFKVAPPVLPFNVDEINAGHGGVDGRYLRFLPTDKANGCFVAIIAREPEECKDPKLSSDKKSKSKLGKSRSAQSASGSSGSQKHRKSLKGSSSLPESFRNGVMEEEGDEDGEGGPPHTPIVKRSGHKSAAGAGARLYQKGVIKKMEKARQPLTKPEHLKVIKHPAPFREKSEEGTNRTSRSHSGRRSARAKSNERDVTSSK